MDGMVLSLFLFGAFIGGLASGLAGFAMGVVVSGIWLHIIPPVQTTTLIVGYGLLTQGYAVWKLRHALNWRRVIIFIITGAIGVPIGTFLLTYFDPSFIRTGVGVFLVLYSTYSLARPVFRPVQAGQLTDAIIGFFNGMLGGLAGLPGIIVTIWCQLRGWSKDEQRTVFQPVNLANIAMSMVALSVAGAVTTDVVKLYLFGLPLMLAGLWSGFKTLRTSRRRGVSKDTSSAFVCVRADVGRANFKLQANIRPADHSRRFRPVRTMSAYHFIATDERKSRHFRSVPKANRRTRFSIPPFLRRSIAPCRSSLTSAA
jgi:uncharacterized membrane protein YfcA